MKRFVFPTRLGTWMVVCACGRFCFIGEGGRAATYEKNQLSGKPRQSSFAPIALLHTTIFAQLSVCHALYPETDPCLKDEKGPWKTCPSQLPRFHGKHVLPFGKAMDRSEERRSKLGNCTTLGSICPIVPKWHCQRMWTR